MLHDVTCSMIFVDFVDWFSLDVGRLSLQRQQLRPGGCGHLGSPDGDQVWIQQTLGGPCYRVPPGFSMRKVHGNARKCWNWSAFFHLQGSNRIRCKHIHAPCRFDGISGAFHCRLPVPISNTDGIMQLPLGKEFVTG